MFTLAVVEDPKETYQSIPLADQTDDNAKDDDNAKNGADDDVEAPSFPRAVTTSIRGTHRHLRSQWGWSALVHGAFMAFLVYFVQSLLLFLLTLVPFMPSLLNLLIVSLTTIQLPTAWVHFVVGLPSTRGRWPRMPVFRETFQATALPTVIFQVAQWAILQLLVLGLRLLDVETETIGPIPIPRFRPSQGGILVAFSILDLILVFALLVPLLALVTRAQASLLPADCDTAVPIKRDFSSKPSYTRPHARMTEAWRSLRGSWKRVYKFSAKVCLLYFVIGSVVGFIGSVQATLIVKHFRSS